MKGAICTYQRCSFCGGKFERNHISTHMTILECPKCGRTPTRYYLDIYDNSERYRLPRDEWGILLSSADHANQLLLEIRKKGMNPSKYVRRKKEPYILKNLTKQWLDNAKQRTEMTDQPLSIGTLKVKTSRSRVFLEVFGDWDIREIKSHHVEAFRLSLGGFKANYRNSILSQLKDCLGYAKRQDMLTKLPDFTWDTPPKQDIPIVSELDQEKVLSHLDRHPIFRFMCLTGCRPSSARALQWEDINHDQGLITFRHNYSGNTHFTAIQKNRTERNFPLTTHLKVLLQPRQISGFVFINLNTGKPYNKNFSELLYTAMRQAKVTRIPLKNFVRHSFINLLLDEGWRVEDVSDLVGNTPKVLRENYKRYNVKRLGKLLEMRGRNGQGKDKGKAGD